MPTTSLELAVRTQTAVNDLAARTRARLAENQGQTAAEYMGIILLVAVIVLALTKVGIGEKLKTGIESAIGQVSENGKDK